MLVGCLKRQVHVIQNRQKLFYHIRMCPTPEFFLFTQRAFTKIVKIGLKSQQAVLKHIHVHRFFGLCFLFCISCRDFLSDLGLLFATFFLSFYSFLAVRLFFCLRNLCLIPEGLHIVFCHLILLLCFSSHLRNPF